MDDNDHDDAHKSSAKKLASRQFKEYTSVRDDDRTDEERLDEAVLFLSYLLFVLFNSSILLYFPYPEVIRFSGSII